MSKKVDTRYNKTVVGLLAVVLILGLVAAFIYFGMVGVLFFTAIALIAGLGGYEIKWLVEAIRSKRAKGNSG